MVYYIILYYVITHIHIRICMYACMYVCVCMYISLSLSIYIYIYIIIYTWLWLWSWLWLSVCRVAHSATQVAQSRLYVEDNMKLSYGSRVCLFAWLPQNDICCLLIDFVISRHFLFSSIILIRCVAAPLAYAQSPY